MKKALLFLLPLLMNTALAVPTVDEFDSKWKNDHWDDLLLTAIDQSILPDITPRDIKSFEPKYDQFSRDEKIQFWGHLLVLLAEKESSFKPNCSYTENFIDSTGTNVVSRGFFQLSYDSATISYKCDGIDVRNDLYKPEVNINCAVKIVSHWLKRDKVISGKTSKGSHRGAARYWSTLRQGNKKLYNIQSNLKKYLKPFGISFDDAGTDVGVIVVESPWDKANLIHVLIDELEKSRLIDIKLLNSKPYIGNYNEFERKDRLEFWTEFFIWIAENQTTDEFFGITPKLAKSYGVSFDGSEEAGIKAAVAIVEELLINDQKITGFATVNGKRMWQGASKIWPVLRDLPLVKEMLNRINKE